MESIFSLCFPDVNGIFGSSSRSTCRLGRPASLEQLKSLSNKVSLQTGILTRWSALHHYTRLSSVLMLVVFCSSKQSALLAGINQSRGRFIRRWKKKMKWQQTMSLVQKSVGWSLRDTFLAVQWKWRSIGLPMKNDTNYFKTGGKKWPRNIFNSPII